jgi:uncharacterized oligopeptide transporter (OPT) family protein
MEPLPLDRVSPQLTLRAVLTGMALGALLSACNVYTGLKIGWGLNMSITAALLSYGFWSAMHGLSGGRIRRWGILENNINQTACSSGAAVSSAGLVAPIPALAMMTGESLTWHYTALWVFSVCLVGITVGIALRRQMLIRDKLRFPFGIAAAETLREMYAEGSEALARVRVLLLGGAAAMAMKLAHEARLVAMTGLPFSIQGFSAKSLTLALDPKLLMTGVGALIGFRACLSLLLGVVVAYVGLAPWLIRSDRVRLTVREPLHALPADVVLPPEPESYARFDPNKHQLKWRGVMTTVDRERLRTLSDEARYREALAKLYLRSQPTLSAPLAEPPSPPLPPDVPLVYDAATRELRATAALTRDTLAQLDALPPAPPVRAAIEELATAFAFTTTRELRISEPLAEFPPGYVFPLDHEDLVTYDRARRRLVAIGTLPPATRDALLTRADEWLAGHPHAVTVVEAFRAAVERLYERSHESFLPPGVVIPEALARAVRYDRPAHTLTAFGVLTEPEIAALRALSDDPDFTATVDSLIAGATYAPAEANYNDLLQWLLWPGVTLMVVSALVSFGFSWRSMLNVIPGLRRKTPAGSRSADAEPSVEVTGEVARRWFLVALVSALVLSVWLQVTLFQILWWAAVLGILLTFVLAIVAARVSGETGITPVGAMGKVTQLLFGVLTPGSPATNLMTANVTGGAASQCADLLHDLKCGYLLGAMPRWQTIAQIFGAAAGAMAGSAIYLIMIPNPAEQLLTAEWPAPAVAAWKAVAELFQVGFSALPAGVTYGMGVAAICGVILPFLEKYCPKRWHICIPSPASVGLAFVIPGYNSISMFLGGLVALLLGKWCRSWSKRFLVAIAAGIVAGEGVTGAGISIWKTVVEALWVL